MRDTGAVIWTEQILNFLLPYNVCNLASSSPFGRRCPIAVSRVCHRHALALEESDKRGAWYRKPRLLDGYLEFAHVRRFQEQDALVQRVVGTYSCAHVVVRRCFSFGRCGRHRDCFRRFCGSLRRGQVLLRLLLLRRGWWWRWRDDAGRGRRRRRRRRAVSC